MTAVHSIKPSKPYPDFPLYAHATKRWAKKIRGKLHYFGPWADPDGALAKYMDQKDRLHRGLTPVDATDELTVHGLGGQFLTFKKIRRDGGELSPRMFNEYAASCKRIGAAFGKGRLVADLRPDDFEKLRSRWVKHGWGPVTIGGEIQRIRTIFKYAYDAGLMDKPIRFGPGFCKPSKKTLRINRAAKGRQMFEPAEIKRMLATAGAQLRAMILLGTNCGFGNGDCGKLPLSAVDLKTGWIDFPRPKTGIPRRCPLWPETIKAIKAAIADRPTPTDDADADLLFVTRWGDSWAKANIDNPLSKEMRKILDKLGINGGRNFYCLRRGFETIAGESRDQVAVDFIMGHSRDDMATRYRQGIGEERLQEVVGHVRRWLYPKERGDKLRQQALDLWVDVHRSLKPARLRNNHEAPLAFDDSGGGNPNLLPANSNIEREK